MKTVTITIELTKEDLEANYCRNNDCPIARSLKRTFGTDRVHVRPDFAVVFGHYIEVPGISQQMNSYLRRDNPFGSWHIDELVERGGGQIEIIVPKVLHDVLTCNMYDGGFEGLEEFEV